MKSMFLTAKACSMALATAMLGLIGHVGAVAATSSMRGGMQQQMLDLGAARVAVAPVLVEFMKELKADSETAQKRTQLVSQWCKETRSQKASMEAVLQRQLNEAKIAEQQVGLQENRLASEARLANSTRAEKERQFQDASQTLRLATTEFGSERDRMNHMLGDTGRALKMVEQKSAQQGASASSSSSDGASASSASPGSVSDALEPEVGATSQSEQLLMELRRMHSELLLESSEANAEQGAMLQKMLNFSDHLNSTAMEAQSQVAAIRVESAQRKREHARIKGRTASLEAMLGATKRSAAAAEAVCADEDQQRVEVARAVREESKAVRSLMSSLPAASSSAADSSAPVSFLQVSSGAKAMAAARRAMQSLKDLAQRFPDESSLYEEGVRSLDESPQPLPSATKIAASAALAAASSASSGSSEDPEYDPLKSIRQFVGDDSVSSGNSTTMSEDPSEDLSKVRTLYSKLLKKLKGHELAVSGQESRCGMLLRDAMADKFALARSSDRVQAKLRIAEASSTEYDQGIKYNAEQRKLVEQNKQKLSDVTKEVEAQMTHSSDRLNGYAQQLLSLATGVDQSDSLIKSIRDLVQRVEEHRALLQQRSRSFKDHSNAAESADTVLMQTLDDDSRSSARQLTRLRAESGLLSSRASAKQSDSELAMHFESLAKELCSDQQMRKLHHKAKELTVEEEYLRKAFPASVVAAATSA